MYIGILVRAMRQTANGNSAMDVNEPEITDPTIASRGNNFFTAFSNAKASARTLCLGSASRFITFRTAIGNGDCEYA